MSISAAVIQDRATQVRPEMAVRDKEGPIPVEWGKAGPIPVERPCAIQTAPPVRASRIVAINNVPMVFVAAFQHVRRTICPAQPLPIAVHNNAQTASAADSRAMQMARNARRLPIVANNNATMASAVPWGAKATELVVETILIAVPAIASIFPANQPRCVPGTAARAHRVPSAAHNRVAMAFADKPVQPLAGNASRTANAARKTATMACVDKPVCAPPTAGNASRVATAAHKAA